MPNELLRDQELCIYPYTYLYRDVSSPHVSQPGQPRPRRYGIRSGKRIIRIFSDGQRNCWRLLRSRWNGLIRVRKLDWEDVISRSQGQGCWGANHILLNRGGKTNGKSPLPTTEHWIFKRNSAGKMMKEQTKYQPFVILSSLNCRFRFIVPIILSLVTHESHIFGDFGNWFNQGVSSEEIIVGCCWHHRLSNLVIICRKMKELITQLNATAASFSVDEILILISDSRSRSSNRCWSKNWWY